MAIQKPLFRMIVGALILSLLIAGAVPAKTGCERACGCHSDSGSPLRESSITSTSSHCIKGFNDIRKVTYQDLEYASFFKSYHPEPNCLEGIISATCHMDTHRDLRTIQGAASTVPRAERSLLAVNPRVSSEMTSNDRQFFLLPNRLLMTVNGAPVPVYLQTLSLLC
jgi:hypothetical protein